MNGINRNKHLSSRCLLLAAALSYNVSALADTAKNDKWYERSFEQILETKIVTATRDQQQIVDSPANMTVYSAADIQRMGLRSIKELLERTTGFFTNKQGAGPAIGSRGFIGDNEQFLMLIDGHNINSIVDKGPGNTFIFPFLEQVKRVEIQRGPGSTLWGSDAALGIIHIITQDGGTDIDGVQTTYSHATEDDLHYLNIKAGEQLTDDVHYMMSFTAAESDGFISGTPTEQTWEALDDSKEFYFKATLRDTQVYARFADIRNQRPLGSIAGIDEKAYTRRKHSYLDIRRSAVISDGFNLEGRFFADLMERWQSLINPVTTPGTQMVEESAASKETALGVELLSRWRPSDEHNILIGLRAVQTEIDPVSNSVTYPVTARFSTSNGSINTRVVPEDKDTNVALFAEDSWAINDSFNIIVGLRIDHNDLREESTIVLPRFAANWKISDQWSAQYSYSTGYIRPPVGIGFLGQAQFNDDFNTNGRIFGANDSQEVGTHDIRISYNRKPISIRWNLYHNTIEDSFNFLFEQGMVGAESRVLFFINTPEINTYGTELEFNYVPSDRWNIYGNLSYVFDAKLKTTKSSAFGVAYDLNNTQFKFGEGAFSSDGTVSGYPHQIVNIGLNYFFSEQISGNLHYRGWNDMSGRADNLFQGLHSKKTGPEHFVDMNIRYQQVAGTQLDMAVFVKNLLGNDDSEINELYFNQLWADRARSIGLKLSYTF